MADLRRRPWTDADNRKLIDLWPRVGSIILIAIDLERSSSSVQTQASRLGLPRRAEGNERHRRKWTPEDLQDLELSVAKRTKFNGEIPICKIADDIGRSIDAVGSKLAETMGGEEELFALIDLSDIKVHSLITKKVDKDVDPRKVGKKRPCLCCRKIFWSEGAHNRLCSSCKAGEGSDWDY